MDDSGSLVKMVIVSYEKKDYSGEEHIFELPVNPETFSKNYKVEYETQTPHGKKGTEAKFNSTAPEEFKIEFTLDGTNSIENYGSNRFLTGSKKESVNSISNRSGVARDFVEKELERFLNTVYEMKDETHRPLFCEIYYGKKLFQGVLANLDINYKLFHPDGHPLRVQISASFIDYIGREEREKKMNQKSPDLSRIRRLKGGEKLEKMVYDFYGDSGFIMQVARANNLTSFRKITVGQELRFPPIDSKEETT